MEYASENDWPALSSVVRPPVIFFVSSDTRIWARATILGSTPARSSRTRSARLPKASRSNPMSSNDETLDARYSARPVSDSESDSTRNPSMRLSPTSRASESSTPCRPGTRPTTKNRCVESSRAATRAPSIVVVRSTTTRRLTPPPPDMNSGNKKTAAKNTGPSSAITQNDFLRTRSTNSRRTTTQILRTDSLRPHQIDEDLVQRRLLQLELRQPRARRHESLQDLLGIGAGRELQLGILAVVIHLAHKLFVCKDLHSSPQAPVEPDDEMVSAMCALDVAEGPVHQLPPPRDDAQLLAQLFGLLHDVGRKQDRLPAVAQVEHRVLHDLRVHRVEPRKWLVQDHE